MEKRRVLRFVAAASAVTGGVTLTGNVVSASPLPSDNNTNGQSILSNQRSMEKGQVNSDVTLNLRVRSDANTSSSILGYLKAGDTFEITGTRLTLMERVDMSQRITLIKYLILMIILQLHLRERQ